MEKKVLQPQPRILMIEDEQGIQTPYYPYLTWNGLGYSVPAEQADFPMVEEDPRLLLQSDFLAQKEYYADLPFVDIERSRKIFSAKNILRDISRRYESVNQNFSDASTEYFLENQAYFHSDLLHLIAATDGNEDTIGHSQLVARYTLLLTKALGIENKAFYVDIERGALLHDIGKIGIPDSILRKPGALTDKEREIVKEHSLLGYELVEEFAFLQKASRVVLFHHESYDGRGYPYGLKAEEIPVEARIFAIADTLDAITSDRPYRKGKSFRAALDEIERVRGIQFDPHIVDVFLSVPEEKWAQVKQDTEQALIQYTIH